MTEVTDPAAGHTHFTARSLALDMDLLDEESLDEIEKRVVTCGTCFEGLETLVAWLDAVGHWDPRVGPEYVLRHWLLNELFFSSDDTHRQRLDRVRGEREFHDWGLARFLLDESRSLDSRSPTQAGHLAELTHAIVEKLDGSFYGSQLLDDLRAEAAANLAVFERRRKRLGESARLFRLADDLLETGTGRTETARLVRGHQSLLRRDSHGREIATETTEDAGSETVAVEPPGLPRPVHRFFERCQAARGSR